MGQKTGLSPKVCIHSENVSWARFETERHKILKDFCNEGQLFS